MTFPASYRSKRRLITFLFLLVGVLFLPALFSSSSDLRLAAQGDGFGQGGIVSLDELFGRDVARQSDGKILVAGDISGGNIGLRRYLSDGRRDNSFGSGGLVVVNLGGYDSADGVIVQDSGRILVAGYTTVSGQGSDLSDFLVLGFRPSDGQLDSSFANNGVLKFDISGDGFDVARAIANYDHNGNQGFIVAGSTDDGDERDFAVARFTLDGAPDTSFSGDGFITIGFGDGDDEANAVAVQTDGKIVVAGEVDDGGLVTFDDDFGAARLHVNGSLDNSFSNDGRVKIGLGKKFESAEAVAIQADGRILLAGFSTDDILNENSVGLVRLNADGSKDGSFGSSGGEIRISLTAGDDRATDLALLPDGRFLVSGTAEYNFLLMRFQANGSPDNAFGQGGRMIGPDGAWFGAEMVREPGGKAVLTSGNRLVRYKEDGELDGSLLPGQPDHTFAGFLEEGLVVQDGFYIAGVARQPDGKIVAAGTTDPRTDRGDFAVRRYLENGRVDTTFGTNGIVIVDLLFGAARAVAVHQNGMIVATGNGNSGSGRNFITAAFNTNGSEMFRRELDPGGENSDQGAYDIAVQKDGKIVVIGNTVLGGDSDFVVARYLANGQLDNAFGEKTGFTTTGMGGQDYAYAMALQSDGKIVAAGTREEATIGKDYDFVIARWLSNGQLDNSFSGDGKKGVGFDNDLDSASDVAIDPASGKIIIVGRSGERIAIARLQPDGDLDDSFSDDGRLIKDDFGRAKAVDMQRGQIVVAYGKSGSLGLMWFSEDGKFFGEFGFLGLQVVGTQFDMLRQPDGQYVIGTGQTIARLQTNSQLDKRGATIYGMPPEDNRAFGMAVQADGKVVIAGEVTPAGSGQDSDFAATRYHPDGRVDSSFADNGRYTFGFAKDDSIQDVAVTSDQKILLAGYSEGGSQGFNFAAVRLDAEGVDEKTLLVDFNGGDDFGQKVLVRRDGGFVVVGMVTNGADREIGLAAFDAQGKLNPGFGNGGKVTTPIGSGFVSARGATLMDDGRIIVVGGHAGDYLILRYHTNGSLDTSFGTGGIVKLNKLGNDEARAVGVLSNGLIAVTGYMIGDFGLLLLHPDGRICTSDCEFSASQPYLLTDFGDDEGAYDLVVQPDDRFIVVGAKRGLDPTNSEFLIARYRFNTFPKRGYGLDSSFGVGGIVRQQTLNSDAARSAVLDGFGRLLVGGYGFNGRDNDFVLARYLTQETIFIIRPPHPPDPAGNNVLLPLVVGAG